MSNMIKKLTVKYVGVTNYNFKQVALVFIAYRLGNDRHIYDTMVMCSNLPVKEYAEYSFIPLKDLDIKFQDNGHPMEIWFKDGDK